MRVISKFQDYYDGGIAYGVDRKIVYEREQQIVDFGAAGQPKWSEITCGFDFPNQFVLFQPPKMYQPKNTIQRGCVFFCGKAYPFYVLFEDITPQGTFVTQYNLTFSWEPGFDDLVKQSEWSIKHYGHWRDRLRSFEFPAVNLYHKSPVVAIVPGNVINMIYGERLVVNPSLKNLRFQNVIDPITAFQEISMYLGTALYPEAEPAIQTDKQKVISHGLDPKYGFRKLKNT